MQILRKDHHLENDVVISLQHVSRTYEGAAAVPALIDITLQVQRAESMAVTGPSGSGKTTLLNIVAGLDRPTAGETEVLGLSLVSANQSQLTRHRARSVGIVFQDAHLLSGLSALENVIVVGLPYERRRSLEKPARELLEIVGLGGKLDRTPARLSGGERQRVAIARALLGERPILIADEPTGNLDAGTTDDLTTLLAQLREERQLTVLVATHDPAVAGFAQRVIRLEGGRFVAEHRLREDVELDHHQVGES